MNERNNFERNKHRPLLRGFYHDVFNIFYGDAFGPRRYNHHPKKEKIKWPKK